jgi:hypothetical protein
MIESSSARRIGKRESTTTMRRRGENNRRCRDLTRPSSRQWLLLMLLKLPASDKVTHMQEKKNTLVVVDVQRECISLFPFDYKCPIYTHDEGYRWMDE